MIDYDTLCKMMTTAIAVVDRERVNFESVFSGTAILFHNHVFSQTLRKDYTTQERNETKSCVIMNFLLTLGH